MAAVTRVPHQSGPWSGTRSALVTDGEVEEGRLLIPQLGFDAETRIKRATEPQLSPHDASWTRALRAAGQGHPSPRLRRRHRWQVPGTLSSPDGLTPAENLGLCLTPSCVAAVEASLPSRRAAGARRLRRRRCRCCGEYSRGVKMGLGSKRDRIACAASKPTFYNRHQYSS